MSSRPGKTAPRLIEDLLRYDPLYPSRQGYNVLTHPAPKVEDGRQAPGPVPGACRHKYMIKHAQSLLPTLDARPDTSTIYKLGAFCVDCRTHLDLTVDFRGAHLKAQPCPNREYPLHHFRHLPPASRAPTPPEQAGRTAQETESHRFECSSPSCPAVLTIFVKPPRLTSAFVSLLTDQAMIKARVQPVLDAAPERFRGYGIPDGVEVLSNVKQYLTDAMRDSTGRRVNASNKRFLTSLGDPCREILEYLGFRWSEDRTEEGGQQFWSLPKVQTAADGPQYQDHGSIVVDDVDKELMVLINARLAADKSQKTAVFQPLAALKDLERCLGCLDYDKSSASRRAVDLTADEPPAYASLGALPQFADTLIEFAYDRQRLCDPNQAPYYYDCLQDIARQRLSEALDTKVVIMESSGEIGGKDIMRAYQYFQLSPAQKDLDDDHIIGCFQSRASSAPLQIEAARQQLRVIGVARGSSKIQSFASNRITTYEEALIWLGAEEATNDDFLISLLRIKMTEEKADRQICRHAASLIAERRNSRTLRHWLETGQSGEMDMGVGEAYRRLGIEDRTLEDDMIVTTFEIRASEAPTQIDDLRAALKAIGRELDSPRIAAYLRTGHAPDHTSADWPVGLENIGNTCYLNSLLQFYFTVKPLRNLILNFDQYEMDVTEENVKRKRVGSRKVTPKEIERAKKFAYELQKLFRSLIAARASAITPERELARLTLIKSSDEEDYRRRSMTASQVRPGLGEIYGQAVQGPLPLGGANDSNAMDVDPETPHDPPSGGTVSDAASESTLVDRPPPYDDGPMTPARDTFSNVVMADADAVHEQRQILDNKENNPPGKDETTVPVATDHPGPLQEASPSRANEQKPLSRTAEPIDEDVKMGNGEPLTPPPEPTTPVRAPPVPPRPAAAHLVSKPVDELELGAQQDVTEVIGNVMFQLECAMKADSIDENGEQHDEIKRLFYGLNKAHLEAKSGQRVTQEYFADIKVNVASGPRDIYAALDGAFDVQEVSLADGTFPQYTSIARLPPILQIHVQRVQYDKESKKMYKSDSHLKLRETIYLDRYLESSDPVVLEKRRATWRWKEELRRLEARREELSKTEVNMDVSDMLRMTKDWLMDLQQSGVDDLVVLDPGLSDVLASESDEIKREVAEIDAAIWDMKQALEQQFSGLQRLPYRLQSVFIHRGTATFGHYWIYIYDFARRIWRKYNDGYVTEVADEKEIYEQDPHYPATPYYLVYVAGNHLDTLVDPVCRDLEPAVDAAALPPGPPAPVPPPLPGTSGSYQSPPAPGPEMQEMQEMFEISSGAGAGAGAGATGGGVAGINWGGVHTPDTEGDRDMPTSETELFPTVSSSSSAAVVAAAAAALPPPPPWANAPPLAPPGLTMSSSSDDDGSASLSGLMPTPTLTLMPVRVEVEVEVETQAGVHGEK
ncbi:MAG: ubiquitin-specific protease ubp2 [Thelocarpon superellum]|nr:MAG: ubiquitin-specific protease ubp2 [Thelocarpon superellum]